MAETFYHFDNDEHEVAFRFSRIIQKWLTPEQLTEVRKLNASEANPAICHSHDVCDPNQAMIDALAELGKKCNPQSLKQQKLIDAAWAIAKEFGFDSQKIYDERKS